MWVGGESMINPGWAVLPLRAVLGLIFLVHGGQKLFGFGIPGTAAFLIAVEVLGGLALLVGAGTRMAATLLAVDMLVALLTVHIRGGFFVPNGIEFVLTLLAGLVTLAGLGPGPWSIDGARRTGSA
jgi:putative oxidoreductase